MRQRDGLGIVGRICDRVVVLEKGRIVEQGPVWQVFGDPQHEVSKTLLAPLQHALPDDLQARLQPEPTEKNASIVLDVQFTGADGSAPDLSALFSAFGGRVSLLHGGIERIQGRALGHLILAVGHSPLSVDELLIRARKLAQHAKVLGYVV